jgi:hypothetical protein
LFLADLRVKDALPPHARNMGEHGPKGIQEIPSSIIGNMSVTFPKICFWETTHSIEWVVSEKQFLGEF